MSRRWLLSLLCLSVLVLSLVPLTRAGGELRVDESRSKVLIQNDAAEVQLAVENSASKIIEATIQLELVDPHNNVAAKTTSQQPINIGELTLRISLPFSVASLNEHQKRQFIWYRVRYRITAPDNNIEGVISLSQSSDLFELRVFSGDLAREGSIYHVRVFASHPITRKPAANVVLSAEVTLEDDDNRSVKLHASKTTNDTGYALLDFQVPSRFPQFPHTIQPAGGEIKVIGRRGSIVAETSGEVLVDQFARALITTDKPIYQPGQVMHVRALAFTPAKRALANQKLVIKIDDEEEITAFRTVVTTSRFGIASADWAIPENTRLGKFRIWIKLEGGNEDESLNSRDVRISRYELPNFSVNVEPDHGYYLPGQNAKVKVRADYLFGKPVTQGNVRVVREDEREWNYREQKWDIEEGDKYEGKIDASGTFVADIDLTDEHKELSEQDYRQYKDITFGAYLTDPTTNRTEQRRFDLRVTKEPIHIYIRDYRYQSRELPLKFYVSTFYADGTPARCKLNISLARSNERRVPDHKPFMRLAATLRTNRYGLLKVQDLQVPAELKDDGTVDLIISAVDANGRVGTKTEDISLESQPALRIETDKTLFRPGEPINISLVSNRRDDLVFVDLMRNDSLIRTAQVRLRGNRGSVTFPYKSDFQDRLTIVAYPNDSAWSNSANARTVLYPQNLELNVRAETSQPSYRPGEDARVDLRVRAHGGKPTESALGVFVIDKAVEERFRTDEEFGQRGYGVDDSLKRFLGLDEQVAGVSLRDLQRLDMSKPITAEMDLVAEILLGMATGYYTRFYGGEQYDIDQIGVFKDLVNLEIKPASDALKDRYSRHGEYPRDEATLLRFLSGAQIDFTKLKDPWGNNYRAVFSIEQGSDVLTIYTAGADEKFSTSDDFSVERLSWRYFLPVGGAIDRAVNGYHKRTGGFVLDQNTLRTELAEAEKLFLDEVRDRWGQPYRFQFDVVESNYVISVSSGGPDKKFAPEPRYWHDDFIIWKSSIDYFAEPRTKIQATLNRSFENTKHFPANDAELREALKNSEQQLEPLRDPWGRRYYATFKTQPFYTDRVKLESRASFGQTPTQQTEITPVVQLVAFIDLRSLGPDGREGTLDDFSVATLNKVISEESRLKSGPQPIFSSPAVLAGTNGAIYGTVVDPNGAVVAGAKVTAQTAGKRAETTTGETGQYLIGDLPAGNYEVRFESTGFKVTVFTNVPVLISNLTQLNAVLEVGAAEATVTVTGDSSAVDTVELSSVSASRSTTDPEMRAIGKSGGAQISTPRLREYFPETLVWQPSVETDKQGRAQITFKLADNITTWKMAVIGSTEDGRVGAIETEIKAFQPFFVEHDPPRVLTEGDEISLPVVVRNYLERTQKVDLEIKLENWFTLLGPARKQTSVPASDAARETFQFRATASVDEGKQRITAIAGDANDAIEKPITVHPDGQELTATASEILGSAAELELNLPETTIPGSHRGELKIYPNLMAHVIEGVEAIMARPYGCGEQTISATYPSLLLLRNYKATGQDFSARLKAERYLKEGYSRLLNYREEDGGFSYWGHGDADIALTAYALRFLLDADEVMEVDEDVIDDAREWLLKRQSADGTWPAREYWTPTENEHRKAVLTAYVTRVIASSSRRQAADKPQPEVISASLKRALDYVGRQSARMDEPYLLASYALAALDVKDTARAKTVVDKLKSLALPEGTTTYWNLETNTPFYGWGLAGRVETSALALQALTRFCESQPTNCEAEQRLIARGLLFLLKQKDRYGVWYSTQATVNVLDAMLTLFASRKSSDDSETTADLVVNGRAVQSFKMPPAKELTGPIRVDLSRYLSVGRNKVEIKRGVGAAFASVYALASYYVPWSNATGGTTDLRLFTKFDKTEGQINDQITCHVSAERVAFRGYGMMLAEIGLPPGAEVDRSSLEKAVTESGWALGRYDVLPDRVVVYLWPRAGGVKFDFTFRPRFGLNAKTAASVVYDYYNPESRAFIEPVRFKVK